MRYYTTVTALTARADLTLDTLRRPAPIVARLQRADIASPSPLAVVAESDRASGLAFS